MNPEISQIVTDAIALLEEGWNTGSGRAFAAPFADDADFVAIRGDHHEGRGTIARGHDAILASIYKGSTIKYEVVAARQLMPGVILGHVKSTLHAPTGPLAGVHDALATVVLVREGSDWQVAAFHNTLVAQPGPKPQYGADA